MKPDDGFIRCKYNPDFVDAEWICPACPYKLGCEDYKKYKEAKGV